MEQILPAQALDPFSTSPSSAIPVVMDDEHGNFAFNKTFRKAYGLKRQFLHAATIGFEYRGKKLKWTADLPEDLVRTLKILKATY